MDECKQNPCNGVCINFPGSYQCICDPGYELRDGRCEGRWPVYLPFRDRFTHPSILIDIDECQNYKCGGRCINLPGTYKCECEKGYKLEGDRCVDEDECATLKTCQGKCINLPGSYRCECDEGYRTERHECIGKIFESSLN